MSVPPVVAPTDVDVARRRRAARRVADLITAVAAGFAVFVLLNPTQAVDGAPSSCTGLFGYGVPCGSTLAGGAALATTLFVGLVLIWNDERRRRQVPPAP